MTKSDPTPYAHAIPGFDFLSKLGQHGATGLGGGAAALPGLPPMSHWIAPVFDPEELDKRIHDLRAVHFWLDQNTKALAATIQALELQKMTLLTLRGMNVSMQEMAESFVVKPAPAPDAAASAARSNAAWPQSAQADPAPATKLAAAAAAAPAQPDTGPPAADPVQWWGALTEQFQTIANEALRDMSAHASRAAEQMAQSVQAGTEAMASAQAAAAASTAESTPHASDPPQSASAKPRKRPPPAPRAARASS